MATEKDLINGNSSKKKYEFTDGLQDAKRIKFKDFKDDSRNGVSGPASYPLSEIQICKCSHQCHKLTPEDKKNLFILFNQKTNDEQLQFIIDCMNLLEPKKRKDKKISQRQAIFHYKLQIGPKVVSVCQKTLCSVLGVPPRRIQIIQNRMKNDNKTILPSSKEEDMSENFNDEICLKENISPYSDPIISSIFKSDSKSNTEIYQLFSEKYPEIEISRQISNDILTESNLSENEFFEDVDDPVNDRLTDENNIFIVKVGADSVRDSLEADGQLGRIKAEMRTEVMKLLDGSSKSSRAKRPKSPHDVLLLNELIREYFDWIGYKYTSNVFITECELGKQPLDRSFLAQDLGVKETEKSRSLPLLFCIIEAFKELKSASMSSC